jgi:hypothetical protein
MKSEIRNSNKLLLPLLPQSRQDYNQSRDLEQGADQKGYPVTAGQIEQSARQQGAGCRADGINKSNAAQNQPE